MYDKFTMTPACRHEGLTLIYAGRRGTPREKGMFEAKQNIPWPRKKRRKQALAAPPPLPGSRRSVGAMAMRSLAGMVTPLKRRVAAYATKASSPASSPSASTTKTLKEQKQNTLKSLRDLESDPEYKLLLEQCTKYVHDSFRTERRKAYAAAGWGTLAYIVGVSVRGLLKN